MNGFSYVTMRFSYGMALILSVAVAFAIDDLRSISILDKKNLIKLKQQKPLITEIPDRHGNSKIGETIDGYVSEAIGVKL